MPPHARGECVLRVRYQILIGTLGPLAFLAAILYGSSVTPGYSQLTNAVSELTQAGAANAGRIGAIFVFSGAMIAILGHGVWRMFSGRDRWLATAGLCILVAGLQAIQLATIFPQDPIGSEASFPGLMHLILVGMSAVLLVAAILLAGFRLAKAEGGPGWFRIYSLATVALMSLGGLLTPLAMQAEPMLIGLSERVTLAAYQLWLLVFALVLARISKRRAGS